MVTVDGHLVDDWEHVFSVQFCVEFEASPATIDHDFARVLHQAEHRYGPLIPISRSTFTIDDRPFERRQYAMAAHYHGRSDTINAET